MKLNEYQEKAMSTAAYPSEYEIVYCTLGINGEAGEIAEKIKKIIRDKNGEYSEEDKRLIALEIGDVMWYCANLANNIGYSFSEVAQMNVDKLESRKRRGAHPDKSDSIKKGPSSRSFGSTATSPWRPRWRASTGTPITAAG